MEADGCGRHLLSSPILRLIPRPLGWRQRLSLFRGIPLCRATAYGLHATALGRACVRVCTETRGKLAAVMGARETVHPLNRQLRCGVERCRMEAKEPGVMLEARTSGHGVRAAYSQNRKRRVNTCAPICSYLLREDMVGDTSRWVVGTSTENRTDPKRVINSHFSGIFN
jgi:hypothetical protein